jgi:predicted nucleotidyltransferase
MRPPAKAASHFRTPLDMVLGTVANVRVLRALSEHGGALATRTLASRAHLTRQAVLNAILRLRALGLVDEVGQARATSYRLNEAHPLQPALRALFATERERSERLLEEIRATAQSLKPRPIAVWLFGSVARGEDRADSDLDLAILSPEGAASRHEQAMMDALEPFFSEMLTRVSVIGLSPTDLRRIAKNRDKFSSNLRRDAIPVYGPHPDTVLRGST